MILADKISKLRKELGWSQEELAERMNVSRQSVSKWESASSIPDLNKIILLAEIFGVSTDYLVIEEIEEPEGGQVDSEPGVVTVTLEEASAYVEAKQTAARLTSWGVLILMYSFAPLFFLLGLAGEGHLGLTEDTATFLGLVGILGGIALAVSFFIRTNQYNEDQETIDGGNFELSYGVRGAFKERAKALRPLYSQRVSVSVTMIILSVVPLLVSAIYGFSPMVQLFMVMAIFLIIGAAVFYMVPVVMEKNAINRVISEGDFSPRRQVQNRKIGRIAVVYWPIVVAVYIGWSLWTHAWGTTWILWPVACVGFGALAGWASFASND